MRTGMQHHEILSALARVVTDPGLPAWWLPAGTNREEVEAALLQGRARLLGTHPGIELRVRTPDDVPFRATSDGMYIAGKFGGRGRDDAGEHHWIDVLEGPLLTPYGRAWVYLEFRPVDLITRDPEDTR